MTSFKDINLVDNFNFTVKALIKIKFMFVNFNEILSINFIT